MGETILINKHEDQNIKSFNVQPYSTEVKVLDKLNAKGDFQPEVQIKISRMLGEDIDIITVIENDLQVAIKKCKDGIKKLQELS